jgi:hypothetical protein
VIERVECAARAGIECDAQRRKVGQFEHRFNSDLPNGFSP